MARKRRKGRRHGRPQPPRRPTPEQRVANLIREAIRTRKGFHERGLRPLPGSTAASDLARADLQPDLAFAYHTAQFQLGAALDHLGSIQLLVRHGPTLYGVQVLTRASIEASARAWWLLDPGVDPAARTARHLTELLHGRRELEKLNRSTGQPSGKGDGEVVERACRYGIDPFTDKRGRLLGFGAARPNATGLVTALLASTGFDRGQAIFQAYSGYTHAHPTALLEQYRKERNPEDPGGGIYYPRVRFDRLRSDVGVALMCWEQAFGRLLGAYSWDDGEWDRFRAELYAEMKQLAGEAQARRVDEGGADLDR